MQKGRQLKGKPGQLSETLSKVDSKGKAVCVAQRMSAYPSTGEAEAGPELTVLSPCLQK